MGKENVMEDHQDNKEGATLFFFPFKKNDRLIREQKCIH